MFVSGLCFISELFNTSTLYSEKNMLIATLCQIVCFAYLYFIVSSMRTMQEGLSKYELNI